MCGVDNFQSKLNIPPTMISWPQPETILEKLNFNHATCLKDVLMQSGMLFVPIKWNQEDKSQGKYEILTGSLATWSVRQILESTANPSLSDDGWNQI